MDLALVEVANGSGVVTYIAAKVENNALGIEPKILCDQIVITMTAIAFNRA